jgi:hypothetical protein
MRLSTSAPCSSQLSYTSVRKASLSLLREPALRVKPFDAMLGAVGTRWRYEGPKTLKIGFALFSFSKENPSGRLGLTRVTRNCFFRINAPALPVVPSDALPRMRSGGER